MADEQSEQPVPGGFIYKLLTIHKASLRSFGIFILVATFIIKTEIRDHVKNVVDGLDRAEAKLSDDVGQTYLLQDFSLLASHISYIETQVEPIKPLSGTIRENTPKTKMDDPYPIRDQAEDMAHQSSVQASQVQITNLFALVNAIPSLPSQKEEDKKELLDYRDRANALQWSSGRNLSKGASDLSILVQLSNDVMLSKAYRWSVILETIYHIADAVSIVLYLLGGSLAFAGKIYGIKELSLE